MCDLVKQIYFKNMKVRGFISLSDTEWQLVLTIFVLFWAHSLESAFLGLFSWMGQIKKITKQNCSTETAVSLCYAFPYQNMEIHIT